MKESGWFADNTDAYSYKDDGVGKKTSWYVSASMNDDLVME